MRRRRKRPARTRDLKRLEAQIDQLTRQLEAMGRGSEGGEH